jgi:hypothetical protein
MSFKKIKSILVYISFIGCFYPFFKECNRRDLLRNSRTNIVKAIVTSEEHILPNSKVSFPFTYGYEFYVDGKNMRVTLMMRNTTQESISSLNM